MEKELYQVVAYIAYDKRTLVCQGVGNKQKRYDGSARKRYAPHIGNNDKAQRKAIKRLLCKRKQNGNRRGRLAARVWRIVLPRHYVIV